MLRRIQRLVLLVFLPSLAHAQAANSYTQSNLISDGSVKGQQTDTQLINPWGVAIGQQTPFWINTAGSGLSEIYDSGGNKQFVVKIPGSWLNQDRISDRNRFQPIDDRFRSSARIG